jgi:hypothetical protein
MALEDICVPQVHERSELVHNSAARDKNRGDRTGTPRAQSFRKLSALLRSV